MLHLTRGGASELAGSTRGDERVDTEYEYDVFVSYRRNGNVRDWVQNHLAPLLHRCLEDELPDKPRVFLDVEQETGIAWPDNVVRALSRSKLLLAVWSPSYFTSPWCMAEWRTMSLREDVVGIGGPSGLPGLVFPIRFSDGNSFPPEARRVQQELSFKAWRFPYLHFRDSPLYLDFHQAVIRLAEILAERLQLCPPWQRDWPIARHEEDIAVPALSLPRL
jgi:hypothetical protein